MFALLKGVGVLFGLLASFIGALLFLSDKGLI